MSSDVATRHCPGCQALVPDIVGPTHPYIGASAGCWAIYGEILAREYSDAAYWAAHRLSVDAYAVQHPGAPGPQAIRSVAVHLVSLFLFLEQDLPAPETTRAMSWVPGLALRWLEPPSSPGELTVLDVRAAADANQHVERVLGWASSVWEAWADHHLTVKDWASRALSTRRGAGR